MKTAVNAPLGLADGERRLLAAVLRRVIEGDRHPLAARLALLRAILAKLEPPPPEPLRPLPAAGARQAMGGNWRRRG